MATFPALDTEPERPSSRRRLLLLGGVLVVLLVAGGVGLALSRAHSPPRSGKAASVGVLPYGVPVGIIAASGDRLVLLRPDGRARRLLADRFVAYAPATKGRYTFPAIRAYVSPDGTLLVNSVGDKVVLVSPGVVGSTNAIAPDLIPLAPSPWTNGGSALVV